MTDDPAAAAARARRFWESAAEAEAALARWGRARDDAASAGDVVPAVLALAAPGARVLDLGCGVGAVARRVAEAGRVVVAADVALAALRETGRRATTEGGPRRLLVDGRGLGGMDDAAFDVVVATGLLVHVPRAGASALAAELLRVLRPGGACLVEFHGPAAVAQLAEAHAATGAPTPLAAFSEKEARALVAAVGFDAITIVRGGAVFLLAARRPGVS